MSKIGTQTCEICLPSVQIHLKKLPGFGRGMIIVNRKGGAFYAMVESQIDVVLRYFSRSARTV